jgi:branched-chain amino acid transport system substrate-binding protein
MFCSTFLRTTTRIALEEAMLGSIRRGRWVPVGAVALALAACGSSSLSSGSAGAADGPVKIGLAVPASGVYEPLGQDMTQGFQLYLDQHGGKLGDREIKLVKADEGEGPDTGVPATTKLVTQDGVSAVVGIVNSATALGLKDTLVQSKVPFIVANAGADDLTAKASEYLWRTSFTNGQVGAALGAKVADEAGGKPVYLLASDYAAGRESVRGFRKTFEGAGGKVAGEAFTPFGTTSDWQPYLSKVAASGAAAIYVFYAGAEAVNFVKQFSAFGLAGKVQLYGAGFLTEGGVLAAQGKAAVGTRTALHYSDGIDSPTNDAFVKAYQEKFDELPTVYAVQAYDAAAVLDAALAEAKSFDGAGVAAAIGGVGEIDSPRGSWKFDDRHNPDQPYFLREVKATGAGFANQVVAELGQ